MVRWRFILQWQTQTEGTVHVVKKKKKTGYTKVYLAAEHLKTVSSYS